MLDWIEWEKLVKDCQKGNKDALRTLIIESQPIVEKLVRQIMGFTEKIDLEETFQEICLRIIKSIDNINNPRAYVRYLRTTTKNYCIDILRAKQYASTEEVDQFNTQRHEKVPAIFDVTADRKGLLTNAFTTFQDHFKLLTEKDYRIRATQKSLEIKKTIDALKSKKIRNKKNELKVSKLQDILGEALWDKEEYNYPEAEKKLRAMIEYLKARRLTIELRYLLAKARTELGHLKMNEGFTAGEDGSIASYEKALKLWRTLNDMPKQLYTMEQIGVSYSIQGNKPEAIRIYESLLAEIPQKKIFKPLKANLWCDESTSLLIQGHIRESAKCIEKSLQYSEDIGGKHLSFSRLQKAKIYTESGKYDKAYSLIMKCIDDTLPYEVLDYVKNNIALFDLQMFENPNNPDWKLVKKIKDRCTAHLFYDQQQELQNRLNKHNLL